MELGIIYSISPLAFNLIVANSENTFFRKESNFSNFIQPRLNQDHLGKIQSAGKLIFKWNNEKIQKSIFKFWSQLSDFTLNQFFSLNCFH